MRPSHFFDTNILLYSISRDPSEAGKKQMAIDLLDLSNGALSIQVFQEFYAQSTRPTRPDAIPHEIAVGLIKAWSRFEVQSMTMPVLESALEIRAAYGYSFWDSSIVAAARNLGCPVVYTEDMSHGRVVDGVMIKNPFLI